MHILKTVFIIISSVLSRKLHIQAVAVITFIICRSSRFFKTYIMSPFSLARVVRLWIPLLDPSIVPYATGSRQLV